MNPVDCALGQASESGQNQPWVFNPWLTRASKTGKAARLVPKPTNKMTCENMKHIETRFFEKDSKQNIGEKQH